jgi:acetylglutamate kinase
VRDAEGGDLTDLKPPDVEALIASKAATGGMIPKLRAGVRACEAGTHCNIVDGREAHALRAVLDGAHTGTRVTA